MPKKTQISVENLSLLTTSMNQKELEEEMQELEGYSYLGQPSQNRNKLRFCLLIIIIQAILNISFLARYYHISKPRCFPTGSPLNTVYSPAQEAIEYKLIKFSFGFGDDITPYQGPPSPEVDAAWAALYPYPEAAVPKSEAAKMANKTSPIPGDESNYMVIPEVLHTLHCLNTIRKALHPEYYNFTGTELNRLLFRDKHMDHCIDAIRQTLMCSSDVTPLVWAWDEKRNMTLGRTDVVHECRDFEKIQEWSAFHRMKVSTFDESVHLPNDLEIPIFF